MRVLQPGAPSSLGHRPERVACLARPAGHARGEERRVPSPPRPLSRLAIEARRLFRNCAGKTGGRKLAQSFVLCATSRPPVRCMFCPLHSPHQGIASATCRRYPTSLTAPDHSRALYPLSAGLPELRSGPGAHGHVSRRPSGHRPRSANHRHDRRSRKQGWKEGKGDGEGRG